MEAILYSQNSWNMVGTFYMWRWISCCFLELWGYVCRYRSQSVDLRSYKYLSMRLCCCLCTQVHRCSCSVTFSSSDRCTLWCVLFATLSGEKDKPVLDIRGMLWIYYASQTTTVALPVFTSLSLVCFELFIFFFFFLGKHWSQNQGSARLPDNTLSQPLSPISKAALPASFCLCQPIVCMHTVAFLQRTPLHLTFVPQSNPSQPIPHQNHFQFISRLSQCEEGSICIPE